MVLLSCSCCETLEEKKKSWLRPTEAHEMDLGLCFEFCQRSVRRLSVKIFVFVVVNFHANFSQIFLF